MSRRHSFFAISALLWLLAGPVGPANAATTFAFEGTVTESTITGFTEGSTFNVSGSFNAALVPGSGAFFYSIPNLGGSLTIEIGDLTFTAGDDVDAVSGFPRLTFFNAILTSFDFRGVVRDGNNLFLGELQSSRFTLENRSLDTGLTGSLRPVGGVPEPGTWLLLLSGFACAGLALSRRPRAPCLVPDRRACVAG